MNGDAKPDLLDVTIDALDAAGDGIAHHRDDTIAVAFTIPGEHVRIRLRQRSPDRRRSGDLVEVLRPSPHRIVPRCQHFGLRQFTDRSPDLSNEARPRTDVGAGRIPRGRRSRGSPDVDGPCGGCTWQHIAYSEQLRLKTDLVDRLVRGAVPTAPRTLPTIAGVDPGDPWGYRHKVHFVFSSPGPRTHRGPAPLLMGHYARGSRRIIAVRECPVHDARGNALAFRLRDAFVRDRIAAADDSRGVLRSVAVRVGFNTPEIMATLVVADDRDKALRAATRRALAADSPTALHLNLHPRGDAYIFGRETRRLSGTERMREEVGGTAFVISPTAFFQTNVRAAEILVSLVLDAVAPDAHVLDLYAGAGLFALPLAKRGQRVIAVEENRAAVADGEASQRLNRIPAERCRFIARPVEQAIAGVRADAVVLDPPREGCSPHVIDAVFGSLRPPRAVYVSCNPEALARDLGAVRRLGYHIVSIQPVDMFPHTPHVETVMVLDRAVGDRLDNARSRPDRRGGS